MNLADDKNKSANIQPGIIYISFLPPRMTVKKVREIFGRYGDIERIFLDPDKGQADGYFSFVKSTSGHSTFRDPTKPSANSGGAGGRRNGKRYTEGWVEFCDKRKAKRAATILNGSPIEVHKRRTPYAGMLWNVKYLTGFKWCHLAEQAAYERASKEQSLRTEVSRVKKETQFYVEKREGDIRRNRQRSGITTTHTTNATSSTNSDKDFIETNPNRFHRHHLGSDGATSTTFINNSQNHAPPVRFDENVLKSIFS